MCQQLKQVQTTKKGEMIAMCACSAEQRHVISPLGQYLHPLDNVHIRDAVVASP